MIDAIRPVNAFSIIGDTISLKTKAQLRAARALLEWSQAVLAERSGVSLPTIKRLEPGNGVLSANHNTVIALERALEAAGVDFTNGDQPGVRLRVELLSTQPRRPTSQKRP
jgi:transcriptional regulator with XRE-family HTH domain